MHEEEAELGPDDITENRDGNETCAATEFCYQLKRGSELRGGVWGHCGKES